MSANPGSTPDPLQTVQEVADRLRCSRDHVYDLISAGELPAINIGLRASKTRLHARDVEAYIERHTRRVVRAVAS